VILSASVPWYVMYAGFLGPVTQTSRVLGPLAPERAGIRFVTVPQGAVTSVMMFDSRGRLRPALDPGASSVRPVSVTSTFRSPARAAPFWCGA
jgi:hypothetical protein